MSVEGKNAVYIGPTRSGKTTAAHRVALESAGAAVVYVDPKPTEELRAQLAPRADALVCYDADYAIKAQPAPRVILLRPRPGQNIRAEADKLLRAVLYWKSSGQLDAPVCVVVDEAHRMGLRKWSENTQTQELFALGRGFGISSTLISQHPRFVPNDLIANCDWVQVWGVHPAEGSPAAHPLISKWWERTAEIGEWTVEMEEWLHGAPHRSVGTDFSSAYLIEADGSTSRTVPLHAALATDEPDDDEEEGGEDGGNDDADGEEAGAAEAPQAASDDDGGHGAA